MMFAFSANVLKTVWIAHGKNVTTFTATSTKDLLSVYGCFSSEKSMYAKAFSFLKFSNHTNESDVYEMCVSVVLLKSSGII